MIFLGADGSELDWISGYTGPPEKFHQKILDVVAGKNTVAADSRLHDLKPNEPEPLIRLGIKFQERQNRPKALELFQQAAALDPGGKIMMRRENGETVSCGEMADYQYARTFMVTFGVMGYQRLDEFIGKHPASPLVRDAYLDKMRVYFTEEDGERVYGQIEAKFPHDIEIANRFAEQVSNFGRYRQNDQDTNVGRSLRLSENALREARALSLSETAQNLARLQIISGNPEKAEKTFGRDFRTGRLKTWAEESIGFAEFWLNRKQNMEDAEAAIHLALSLNPEDPSFRRRAAALYLSPLAKPEKALEVYGPEYFKTIQPSPDDLYSYFGFWINNKSNEAGAFAALEDLLKLKPDSIYYREYAASALSKAGYQDRALAVFGPEFIGGRPDDMNALYEYGMFWIQKRSNMDGAVQALVKSLRTIPRSYMNQYSAAQILLRAKRLDDASAIYGPGYQAGIQNDASALGMYAQFWLMEAKTNKDSAIEALEAAARIPRLEIFDRTRLARLFLEAGRPARAESIYGPEFLRTISANPEDLIRYASFWKAVNRNLFSAIEGAQRASRIAPGNETAWYLLAQVYVANGNLKDALSAIEKACGLTKSKQALKKYEDFRNQIKAELDKAKK